MTVLRAIWVVAGGVAGGLAAAERAVAAATDAVVEALLIEVPPAPANQAAIVAANIGGRTQQAA